MYKRYYSPFEENPIKKEYVAEEIKPHKLEQKREKEDRCDKCGSRFDRRDRHDDFFANIGIDDIILIGLLIILLMEDKENRDLPLLLAIGFLLLIEFIDNDD
ncbi:MAG: hypothetical protein BWY15_00772 [Firmicutes bacterium ADurb.Bin193]|nr:MAG: hypothetical protein BWY15_00772 [Firmicutes bacterium ADurb.Bin193]